MSACFAAMFVGWLLLMDLFLIKNIEATSTSQSIRNNKEHLKISATAEGPLCTSNGIDYVLFTDQSQLDEANRKRYAQESAYEKVAMGFCQTKCNLVCATVYTPVCAVDATTGLQRSFYNPCEMSRDACLNNIAWQVQAIGPCLAMSETTRPILMEPKRYPTKVGLKYISCTKVFNPVCATFAGVKSTFNNECLVYAENVKTGHDWTISSNNVCAEDYSNFQHNADQMKYHDIRSFYNTISHTKQSEADRYYNDMTFFYTPPIFKTEYVDKALVGNFGDPRTKVLRGTFNQHRFRYPHNTRRVQAETQKTIHLSNNHNGLDKVIRCKYGSEPICGTYINRYRSFDNVCELMLRNILLNQTWTIAYEGYCIKKSCPQKCTEEYAPVCVSKNGANFTITNLCLLNLKQCQEPQSTWKFLAKGECGTKILLPILSKATTVSLVSAERYEPFGSVSRFDNKYSTTTAPRTTTKMDPVTTMPPPSTTKTIAPITTTPSPSSTTTTTTTVPTSTTTSKSITGLTFDTQKSIITPKHYVSLTTSEARKTTTPITLSTYHSTTKAPVAVVISAKKAPVTSARTSIYGAHRNSIIMRLARAKAFASPKYSSAVAFNSLNKA